MVNPKVSVIMPSLNVKPYIKQCIESVINQTLKDIEIICVDSGSDDGTLEVLEEYAKKDSRITLIKSETKSYGNQVNIGISKATGDYISIIETDDYIKNNMLERLYSLSENSTIDLIKGTFYHFDDTNPKKPNFQKDTAKNLRKHNGEVFTLKEQPKFVNGHPSIWAGIYRRKFLKENNIKLLEEPAGGWVDNPFFFETAICAKSIKYLNEPFYYYRISNPNSSSNTFSTFTLPMKRVLDIFDVLKRHNYKNTEVTILFYNRLFRYIEIILENNDLDPNSLSQDEKIYINKVLQKVDERIVNRRMIPNFQKLYYKFKTPLFVM